MFRLRKPSEAAVARQTALAEQLGRAGSRFLSVAGRDRSLNLPLFFSRDYSESLLGEGATTFAAAGSAFERWEMLDLGWVRIVNKDAQITPGQVVGVEVYSLGLWSLNFNRIVELVDTPTAFGFLYATTQLHVEEGEERFLLRFDQVSGVVTYTLEAVSRPRSPLARVGFPVTRAFQHKFARDSHRRMLRVDTSG